MLKVTAEYTLSPQVIQLPRVASNLIFLFVGELILSSTHVSDWLLQYFHPTLFL